ncbi:MAG: hypothetical protein IKM49_01380, partial [Ruminococcus sp.]|nr:hypothetical protein [Ruminococcus sp.]
MEHAVRKKLRLEKYDYSRNGAYFVTVCTKNKQQYFWDFSHYVGGDAHIAPQANDISTAIPYKLTYIGETAEKYIQGICGIKKYVIMPDHIHLLIRIDNDY